jgi:hypothetical protein
MSQINGCGTALVSSVGWASIRSGPGLRGRHREAGRRIGRAPSRHTAGAAEPTPGHFHYSDMSMTFSDLVEEIRHRPVEERVELREILEKDLIAARRAEIHQNHAQSLEELKNGTLTFSSDFDELMDQLNGDE